MDPIKGRGAPATDNVATAAQQFFKENNYVVLTEVLPSEEIERLTKYMFELKEKGLTERDPQCPTSDAIYGAPEFDEWLQKLAKPIGAYIGVELLPCYSYARLYHPGETLKIHRDRPSCEYSGTMTLGFKGKQVWPIYFDKDKRHKIELMPGEMAMYKGCDVDHWRTEFKGEWQVQVFFHYVDANGPYKNQYADGRKSFGMPKSKDNLRENWQDDEMSRPSIPQQNQTDSKRIEWPRPIPASFIFPSADKTFPGYFCVSDKVLDALAFTPEECAEVIDIAKDSYPDDASIGGAEGGVVVKQIRDAEVYSVMPTPTNMWLFNKIATIVSAINTHHFDYDISGITHGLQLLHYKHKPDEDTDGHYSWHIDSGPGPSATRKISISVQLTEDKYYEGGELEVFDHGGPVIGTKQQGSVHLFPSYMPHQVHPVTKGERWALVVWIHGHKRFR
jgi:hypothetical protein